MPMKKTMTASRQGEIAKLVLRRLIRTEGIHLVMPDAKKHKQVKKRARQIGVPLLELLQFYKPLAQELLDDAFKALADKKPRKKANKKKRK